MDTTAASWIHSAAIGGCVRKQNELSLRINFVTWLEFMIGINWMLTYPIQEKKSELASHMHQSLNSGVMTSKCAVCAVS